MSVETVKEVVMAYLQNDLGVSGPIGMHLRLIDDLELDSLDMVDLIMRLEQKFQLPDNALEQLDNAETVGEVIGLIEKVAL